MKEIRFSFDDDDRTENNEDIDMSEYKEYIRDLFSEPDDEADEGDEEQPEEEFGSDTIPEHPDTDGEFDEDEEDGDSGGEETKRRPRRADTEGERKISRAARRRLAVRIAGGAAAAAAIGAVFLASPVFAVRNIEINDTRYFTSDEICSKIGLYTGDNGVFFNKGRAEKILESDKYISEADVSFRFPDTMVITIDENRIYGYINYLGDYLYIDREGRVIDVKGETEESLPVIEGLKFNSFTIGEVMRVENEDSFEAALIISNAMSKYEVEGKKVSVNVADCDNLYAYIDNIKVLLGDTSRMEEKIKTMAEAVAEIPEGDMGTLDLQDLSKPIIFKYST